MPLISFFFLLYINSISSVWAFVETFSPQEEEVYHLSHSHGCIYSYFDELPSLWNGYAPQIDKFHFITSAFRVTARIVISNAHGFYNEEDSSCEKHPSRVIFSPFFSNARDKIECYCYFVNLEYIKTIQYISQMKPPSQLNLNTEENAKLLSYDYALLYLKDDFLYQEMLLGNSSSPHHLCAIQQGTCNFDDQLNQEIIRMIGYKTEKQAFMKACMPLDNSSVNQQHLYGYRILKQTMRDQDIEGFHGFSGTSVHWYNLENRYEQHHTIAIHTYSTSKMYKVRNTGEEQEWELCIGIKITPFVYSTLLSLYHCCVKQELWRRYEMGNDLGNSVASHYASGPFLLTIQADEDALLQIEFLKCLKQSLEKKAKSRYWTTNLNFGRKKYTFKHITDLISFFSFSGRGREVFESVFGFEILTASNSKEFGVAEGEEMKEDHRLFPAPTSKDYTVEAIEYFLTTHTNPQSLRVINIGVSENTKEVIARIQELLIDQNIISYHSPNYFLQNHTLGIEAQKIASLLLPD